MPVVTVHEDLGRLYYTYLLCIPSSWVRQFIYRLDRFFITNNIMKLAATWAYESPHLLLLYSVVDGHEGEGEANCISYQKRRVEKKEEEVGY